MSDDYEPARWIPADPSNFRAAGRSGFKNIVIHITDGHEYAEPVAAMWQDPNHKSSAHFVIGQDGTVIQAVRIDDVAWHAHAVNATSIGIEHCARSPHELSKDDPGIPPSEAQYEASAKLTAYLCWWANLPPDRNTIQGHAEIDPATTHEDCPNGCGWDWDHYMTLVKAEFEALPMQIS